MTKIVQKPLPHGIVPYADMTDPAVKKRVMLLNENIVSLATQVSELQRAIIELQNKPAPKQKEIKDIERYVAQASASAESAATSATSASNSSASATGAATSAGNYAVAAGTSEANAGQSATEAGVAKAAAESARDYAVPAAATATQKAQEAEASANRAEAAARSALSGSVNYVNVDLGTTARETIYMEDIIGDTNAQYDVRITFMNETATKRAVKVNGVALNPPLPGSAGAKVSTTLVVGGNGSFTVDNMATTVQVFIQAWRK